MSKPASNFTKNEKTRKKIMTKLKDDLQGRLGRPPTEQELFDFIYGTDEDKDRVWGKEANDGHQ